MDLRMVRFRAWELGLIASPPPCQQRDGSGRAAAGCWCFLEPAATRRSDGTIMPRKCPPYEKAPPEHVTESVGWGEDK